MTENKKISPGDRVIGKRHGVKALNGSINFGDEWM